MNVRDKCVKMSTGLSDGPISSKIGYEPTYKVGFDNSKLLEKIELLMESKLDERLKPLQNKIKELEAENRRMKIALRFLESELKECMKSNSGIQNSKSLFLDPKKRLSAMKDVNDLSQANHKKPKTLLDDKLTEHLKSMCTQEKMNIDEYTNLPSSVDKIQISNEEKQMKQSDNNSKGSLQCPNVSQTNQSTNSNQLYLAIPTANNSTNLVPLVLQSSKSASQLPLVFSTPNSLSMPSITSSNEKNTSTPAALLNGKGKLDLNDSSMEEDDEIEVVPPPPPKSPLAVIDLSEDEGDSKPYEDSEILPGAECTMHPLVSPVLPFVVSDEKSMPPPTLKARTGRGKDGKKAVVLRMESKISGVQNLQYRVFSYFENITEPVKDRRWKQLTCIKVQSGRVCECTLTHLMEKVRYHFVVCLVQGNNRSKFSNCAPHVY